MIRLATAVAVVLVVLPGCGTQGLNFVQDERLEIIAPGDREKVDLPVTVRWTTDNFDVTGRDGNTRTDAGYFGIYVDRVPQPPGKTQEWIVRDDPKCDPPTCPDEAYLAGLNVFRTESNEFTIERLPLPSTSVRRRRDFHEATVVLLDGRGARIGESAFTIQFEVNRDL